MMWLFGPAGAGKSAIAKRIAEITAERDLLIADFFFSRASPTRNTKDRLIATLAYQLTLSIPDTRAHIEDAIERDPAIFNKNVQTQIHTLLIKPFQTISSTQIVALKKLIIIDGLDECNDSQAQVAILEAIVRSFARHNLPIKFLVVSRPEISLVNLFTTKEPLKSIHRRLSLDDTYKPDDDIRLFFSDKFEQIQLTHPLKSHMTLVMLCKLLGWENTSPALVEFTRDHDIHPAVKKDLSADRGIRWDADMHILAFLSRASVCVNWRIVSAIQRSHTKKGLPPSKFHESDEKPDEQTDLETIRHLIRQRVDQCCLNTVHVVNWNTATYPREVERNF